MTHSLEPGQTYFGSLQGMDPAEATAHVQFDDAGAIVSRVRRGRPFAGLEEGGDHLPQVLHYLDPSGHLVFCDCRSLGSQTSSNGMTIDRVRSSRIIHSANTECDYELVDGMCTELDGLAQWCGLSTVTTSLSWSKETPGVKSVTIEAANKPSIEVGGAFGISIGTSFTHNPSPKGNVYSLIDIVNVRTHTGQLRPWGEHAAVHRMMQDLMCLVYGKPCQLTLKSIKREDDQYGPVPDGDDRRWWREAYEPNLGRGLTDLKPLDRYKDEPLFTLADVDPDALRSWLDGFQLWSRPTWIAVSSMFQMGTAVEVFLLQIGVALEALGHSIWMEETSSDPSKRGKTPSYPALLERVTKAACFDELSLHKTWDAAQWREEFNTAFKGAKHADNPMTDPHIATERAREGLKLIRYWLAIRLGVKAEQLCVQS
ncbi:hypothetical protein [Kocuria marina]|uniref:ApeA N-terminal domain 1-containing protein n=1 Tax=Kocuria marina TaxID=223184 RepID=UPI0022E63FFD|nr:hypothetical protein [Kocuria marina]